MKKAFLFIILVTSFLSLYSQDIIVRKNGQMVRCKVLDVDSTHVYFILSLNDIKTSLLKSEIREIQYGNEKQVNSIPLSNTEEAKLGNAITVGLLEGGGSLVGFDCETMISKSYSVQVGAGIIGFGLGFNKHLKPTVNSSFLSLQYWHQGFGNRYTQALIGPGFVFRAKKVFTFQIGLGYAVGKGPAWPVDKTQPPVMLTYAIGAYFPFY